MPDQNKYFETQHLRNLQNYQKEVEQEYLRTIEEVFRYVALTTFATEVFRLADYPVLKNQIDETLRKFRDRIYNIVTRAIRSEWGLSDRKNNAVIKEAYGNVAEQVLTSLQSKPEAVTNFINRYQRRLKLSDRVWKLHGQFYQEIEMNLYASISEGKAARRMAAEMKQFLKEPDRLYRRVRNSKGRLVLSSPARAYKPGAGVYRSSFKNALRLTRTETNRAYRTADHERWKNSPFILGVEVKLSVAHPRSDFCNYLVGLFPPDYKHTGFHIQCLCYSVPVLPTPEEYNKYEDALLAGKEKDFKFEKVKDIHPRAKQWIIDNAEKIEGWKNPPLFMQDNPKYIKRVLTA